MLKLDSCLQIWSPMFIILSDFRFQQKNLFCMFLCIIRKYNIFWPQWRKLDPKDSYRPHVVMQTWIQQSFLNLSDFRFEQKKCFVCCCAYFENKACFTPMEKTWSRKKMQTWCCHSKLHFTIHKETIVVRTLENCSISKV